MQIDREEINAAAHCGKGTCMVEAKEYKPQSQTTQNMINIVSSAKHIRAMKYLGWFWVFDPPSNKLLRIFNSSSTAILPVQYKHDTCPTLCSLTGG